MVTKTLMTRVGSLPSDAAEPSEIGREYTVINAEPILVNHTKRKQKLCRVLLRPGLPWLALETHSGLSMSTKDSENH